SKPATTAGASKAATTIKQLALAPSPQSRPAPTPRAIPSRLADQRGTLWTPIGGPSPTPIDTYECRFRSYSHGLAPVNAPNNALVISSNTPGEVADATKGEHSVFVTELLNELNAPLARKASSTGPASPSFALPMARRYRRYPPRSWRTCTSVPAMIPI